MIAPRIRSAAAVTAALVVLLSACGGGGSEDDGATSGSAAPSTAQPGEPTTAGGDVVTIVGFAFEPGDLEVEAGSTVSFTNEDSAAHTATADGDAPQGFDTDELGAGEAAEVTFDEEGEYRYYCAIHDYMEGTIRVVGAEG